MKIWLDLANSPQVLFFRPIIRELERHGHEVWITTREYAQTIQLADQLGLSHQVIGKHGGRGLVSLAQQLGLRAMALSRWAKGHRFDLALSHNSYSQVVAARMLGIQVVTLMDYEHQPLNHLCFRLAHRVIVPQAFPKGLLKKFGAARKTFVYEGVKEQIYLADFSPTPNYREREQFPSDKPLIVIRPPAPWTAYHRFENDLFDQVLRYLNDHVQGHLLFIPRLASQGDSVREFVNINVAKKVYDGPNLLYYSDAVISGGGTMNREAAVLGTPTYTIFKGELGAVDRDLILKGRMVHLQGLADFGKIRYMPDQRQPVLQGQTLLTDLIRQITT
ncbi:MAG: DUF354 domain-containing protein [Anaerolineales bacterium]